MTEKWEDCSCVPAHHSCQPYDVCLQIQVRLQRPTVVAEIGFMLSVTKFFVPGVAMSGITPTAFESNDVVLEGELATQILHILLAMTCQQLTELIARSCRVCESLHHSGDSVVCL